MQSKHIPRDYSAHKKSIYRPYDEFVKLEIFSYDPKYNKQYLVEDNTLIPSKNCEKTSWKSWTCYKSKDGQNDMVFDFEYDIKETGNYRFDVIYEFNNSIYNDKKKDTDDLLVGSITITSEDGVVRDSKMKFDGVNNVIKRRTVFNDLNTGLHTFNLRVPHNCYCLGVVIRRVLCFAGDNYYGSNYGKEDGNLTLMSATFSKTGMVKPSELSCEIAYDDALECETSPSGFYIDYMDEVNFYVKSDNKEIVRIFGGYISSILPNADRTKLTINCADRLNDGQNKYILDQMTMLGGTKSPSDFEYKDGMTRNFDYYPQALQYLCYVHETTLRSNISKSYTVDGEKYQLGLQLTYGTDKKIKKIATVNGMTENNKNFIMLRNNSDALKEQTWTLYEGKDYSKLPVEITETPYLHISYGLGDPKTEIKTTTTETVDVSDTKAGSQKFTKCGVSEDGKYVMGIGLPSAGKDSKSGWTKAIFERKCPHCGSSNMVWDWNWGSYSSCRGASEGGSAEGHFFCKSCDADYSVQGHEHISGSKYSMKRVGSIQSSSRDEAWKLKNGNMTGLVNGSGTTVTPDQIFKAISNLAFKYNYSLSSSNSWSNMKKTGSGDCWAFSDLIFDELKKYGVSCKIVQYSTQYSEKHRSVLYADKNGNYVDFPYREYGWGSRYNNMLNNTSASKNGAVVKWNKAQNMGNMKAPSGDGTQSQTTTVTTTLGYDKDKPYQAYLKLTYSLDQSWDAKKFNLYIKFTQDATMHNLSINTGLSLFWINNMVKKVKLDKDLTEYLRVLHEKEDARIFLHSLQFISPKKKDDDGIWYKVDNSTQDFSSCKIDLYQIFFDNMDSPTPSDLNSCGKTVNSVMEDIVEEGGYYVDISYGLHRASDLINFRVNNQTGYQYTAKEGDENNILAWNNISYNPLSNMHNMSMQVFKQADNKYYYINTREPRSILHYGEQCSLETNSTTITSHEAYYNAVMNKKYDPSIYYTYTITVPNFPNLRIGDYVKVLANAKKLNSVKEVKSIKISFDTAKMPRIRTELGLDELAPDLQLKENIRKLRNDAKAESTEFDGSAMPVSEDIYYQWDR